MKKAISLFLTLVMMLSLVPAAFAASDEATQAANNLHNLGLFEGVGTRDDGTINYDLDRTMTRAEAITMLVRLLGKEDEAKATKWQTPFTDVAEWAKPYVGYAYAHSLTSGVSPRMFGSSSDISATQYLTFVLRALGYSSDSDFQWDKAWELTDRLSITNGQYNANTVFERSNAVIVSNKALSAKIKNTGNTLLASLQPTSGSTTSAPDSTTPASTNYSIVGVWSNYDKTLENTKEYVFSDAGDFTYAVYPSGGKSASIEKGSYTVYDSTIKLSYNAEICYVDGSYESFTDQKEYRYELTSSDTLIIDSKEYTRIAQPSITPKASSLILAASTGTTVKEPTTNLAPVEVQISIIQNTTTGMEAMQNGTKDLAQAADYLSKGYSDLSIKSCKDSIIDFTSALDDFNVAFSQCSNYENTQTVKAELSKIIKEVSVLSSYNVTSQNYINYLSSTALAAQKRVSESADIIKQEFNAWADAVD